MCDMKLLYSGEQRSAYRDDQRINSDKATPEINMSCTKKTGYVRIT